MYLRIVGFLCLAILVLVVSLLVLPHHLISESLTDRFTKLSGGNILTPAAIFLSALVAGAAAAFSIAHALAAAKCRNTLDFLNLKFTRPDTFIGLNALREIVSRYEKEHPGCRPDSPLLHAFANEEQYSDLDFQEVRRTLNYYEHLALGVRKRIYDERLVFEDMGYTIFRLWRRCATHVTLKNTESKIEMLQDYPNIKLRASPSFSAFIWLVERWRTPWYCRWLPRCPASRKKKLQKLQEQKEELESLKEKPKKTRKSARHRSGRSQPK